MAQRERGGERVASICRENSNNNENFSESTQKLKKLNDPTNSSKTHNP